MTDYTPAKPIRKRLEKLRSAIEGARRIWILLHDGPDPDAMAGGMLMQRVVEDGFGREARITYGGIIGRPDNRAMPDLLGITMFHVESIDVMPGDRFVCVDTQPVFTNNSLPEGAEVAAVIDHHPREEGFVASYVDVRPEMGSVSTIGMEYLRALGLEITRPVATAVAYAIISETEDLGRAVSPADLRTYMRVLQKADHLVIGQLRHPRVERRFFRTLTAALKAAQVCEDVVISHLADINAPDELARVADILNPLADTRWVLCTGLQNNTMIVTLRSSDTQANAERLMVDLLAGRGGGGGHGMVAGGQFELKEDEEPRQVRRKLTRRFLQGCGYSGDEDREPLLQPPPEDLIPPEKQGLTADDGSGSRS